MRQSCDMLISGLNPHMGFSNSHAVALLGLESSRPIKHTARWFELAAAHAALVLSQRPFMSTKTSNNPQETTHLCGCTWYGEGLWCCLPPITTPQAICKWSPWKFVVPPTGHDERHVQRWCPLAKIVVSKFPDSSRQQTRWQWKWPWLSHLPKECARSAWWW